MDKNTLSVRTYDKIARVFADKYFDYSEDLTYVDKFISLLTPNAKILDVGCGVGGMEKYFSEKGFVAEGVDLSKETIKIAKEKVPEAVFKVMDMRKLDYVDSTFDALISTYSLIHIEPPQVPQVLQEYHRVLKTNGLFLLIVQGGQADSVLPEPLDTSLKQYFNFFSVSMINRYLREADFKVIFQTETPNPDKDCYGESVIFTFAQKSG